jgi:cytoskeleton protein RodZ
MNEPVALVEGSDSRAAEIPPEIIPPEIPVGNFGAALRAAREAAGISVPTLAGRLRLNVKQIEALERSDLAALPTLIYVRGYVRGCARELKIDAVPLLEDLDRRAGVVPGTPLTPVGNRFHFARLGDGSRSIVAIVLVVLVIAGIIGTLWPRRPSVPTKQAVAELVAPTPVAPADDAPAAAAAALGGAAHAAPPSGASAGVHPALAPVSRPPALKASPARLAESLAATVGPAAAEPASEPAAVPAAPPADIDEAALVLHVHAPSWVEVVQANGTSVLSQICPAGSVQTVHGVAPLRIVIGNAAAVDAQYHGVTVDLSEHANANGVARLTLQ